MPNDDPVRTAILTVESLPDELIRSGIHALVHGLVHGMLDDLTARADDIVDGITESITTQLAGLAESRPSNDGQMSRQPAPAPAPHSAAQDAIEHTCIMCGRTGTRRFIETRAGWCCAPSSAEACARKTAEKDAARAAARTSDIPVKTIPAYVTPPAPKPSTPGLTARCQDCSRTFTLTGRPLQLAVEMHELKHSHIVNVIEEDPSA